MISEQLNLNWSCPAPAHEWGKWSKWGPCSVTCGGGTQARKRTCAKGDCSGKGDSMEIQSCGGPTCREFIFIAILYLTARPIKAYV